MHERWIESWSFRRLVEAVGGQASVPVFEDICVRSVSTDTRTLEHDALFVALVGENFDGHQFVRQAELKGAAVAIVSEPLDVDLPLIVVDDTLVALQQLAKAVFETLRNRPDVRTIAITGSNGKTTTKEYVRALAGEGAYATPGNLNNHIGLPLTILNAPASATTLVLEMGANKFGDIDELISIAPTEVRVITSIGDAHLEGFGNRAGVLRAKSEIFNKMSDTDTAVVTTAVSTLLEDAGLNPTRLKVVGSSGDLTYDTSGSTLTWTLNNREGTLTNPFSGEHNHANLALSLMAVDLVTPGLPTALQSRLDTMALPDGRSRIVTAGGHEFFDDAYNANPSSIDASFQGWLSETAAIERRIAIVGEVFELGSEAEAHHLNIARTMVERTKTTDSAISLVFVGQFAGGMKDATDSENVFGFETTDEAAKWLKLQPKSHVFLKGSRGMKMERIIELMDE